MVEHVMECKLKTKQSTLRRCETQEGETLRISTEICLTIPWDPLTMTSCWWAVPKVLI